MFIIFSMQQIKLRTCVQGEGGQGHHYALRTRREGEGQKLSKFCVRTLWMALSAICILELLEV